MFNFYVTKNAEKRLEYLISLEKYHAKPKLRVIVDTGGCSGMQYIYKFTNEIDEKDDFIVQGKVQILIDSISQKFLSNCTIDYIETLGNSFFKINNPNAKALCGCGSSFALM